MARAIRWRDSYNAAFRERGSSPSRMILADSAISQCVESLIGIAPKRTGERAEIHLALEDLRVLKALCRKYRRVSE